MQNIAGGLDAAVSAPDLAPAPSELANPLGLQLRAPLALHHALTRQNTRHLPSFHQVLLLLT